MAPAHATVQVAYGALSAMQDSPAAQQVAAAGFLFWNLCDELGLDPSQQFDAARRLTRIAQEHYSIELKGLRDYIINEIKLK